MDSNRLYSAARAGLWKTAAFVVLLSVPVTLRRLVCAYDTQPQNQHSGSVAAACRAMVTSYVPGNVCMYGVLSIACLRACLPKCVTS